MLYHLIYRARTTARLSAGQLADWLQRSRAQYASHAITGMLLCAPGGEILHVLEGPAAAVRQRYQELSTQDPCQAGHEIVSEGPWRQRSFATWSTSCPPESGALLREETGYVDFQDLETLLPELAPTRPLLVYRVLDFVAAHIQHNPAQALCYA